jgi:hypothetical protein
VETHFDIESTEKLSVNCSLYGNFYTWNGKISSRMIKNNGKMLNMQNEEKPATHIHLEAITRVYYLYCRLLYV